MGRTVKKHRGIFERPKGSGIWWVCYFDQYGKKHREKVGMKSAAINVYRQRKTEIRQGKFEPEDVRCKHQSATVTEIIDDYVKASEAVARKSIDDIRQRANWWKDRLGDKPAKSVLKCDIESARLDLAQGRFPGHRQEADKKGRSVATVNRYLATLKAVFLMAMENEQGREEPVSKGQTSKGEQHSSSFSH